MIRGFQTFPRRALPPRWGILDEAIAANSESLATVRGERRLAPEGVQVRRIYIPGNHDRLYLHDAALRERVLGALGAVDGAGLSGEGIFLHRLQMPDYGLLARHGHELRPLMSAFHWSFYEIQRLCRRMDPLQARALERAFNDTLHTIAADFRQLELYRAWVDSCRDPLHFGGGSALLNAVARSAESERAREKIKQGGEEAGRSEDGTEAPTPRGLT